MKRVGAAAVLIMLAATGASLPAQQDKPPAHNSKNPWQCRVCAPPLEAARKFILQKAGNGEFYDAVTLGYLSLVDPQNFGKLRTNAVATACAARSVPGGSAGGSGKDAPEGGIGSESNHHIAIGALFLSECFKRGIVGAGKVEPLLRNAAKTQAETGGWHHFQGFDKSGYSKDLAILTCMLYAAMMNCKAYGQAIPAAEAERAEKNLLALRHPTGIAYGTDNAASDEAGSRAAYVLWGLNDLEPRNAELYEHCRGAMQKQFPTVNKGHVVGSMHFLAVAIAAYYQGPQVYEQFASMWVDKLIAKQRKDGSIWVGDDGVGGGEPKKIESGLASTAAFCLVLLLQNPDNPSFETPRMKKAREAEARRKKEEERRRKQEEKKNK